ncbi:MAG: SPOR domain-containing protein [Sodalis sp. (in: enterobacteria)]
MASKFQNRIVGTIVLVALGIIVLPGLLDGKKNKYQEEFATIPLVPKLGASGEFDMLSPANEQFQTLPPEMKVSSLTDTKLEVKALTNPENKSVPKLQIPKVKTPKAPPLKSDLATFSTQKWVVQLGALKNANKVSRIVSKLRFSGYYVYTAPYVPVQGQITRIFVYLDISQNKLQSALSDLKQLSGLNGQLQPYKIR